MILSAVNASGSTTEATKLGNIADGEIAPDSKEAVTGGQLHALQNEVTAVANTANAGFALSTGTQEVVDGKVSVKETAHVGQVKPNTTVVMVDGKNTKVSKVDSGLANVISYTVEVNGIPMSYVNSKGDTLVKVGDKFVGVNQNGEIDPSIKDVAIAGLKVVNPANPDKGLTVDNVAEGKVAQGSKQAVNGAQLHATAQSVADVLGNDFENKEGKVTVKNGTDGIGGTGKATISDAFKEVVRRSNIDVESLDGNIVVEKPLANADKQAYKVGLNKDIKVENSITIGQGKVKITSDPAYTDKYGNQVPAALNLNGARLTGIADGVEASDVATVGQVNRIAAGATQAISQVNARVDNLTKESRSGIAGAMAAAGLQQATQPGRTTFSMGAATFKGESAVALGFSRLSDNGKLGVRFSGMTSSAGNTGASVSVGYTW